MACRLTSRFEDMPVSADVENRLREHTIAIEREFGAVASCEAQVAHRHRRHMPGDEFDVRVALHLEGSEPCHVANFAHDDPAVALAAAFTTMRHILRQARTRDMPGETSGHVMELHAERGSGTIQTDGGVHIPIDRAGENDAMFDRLHVGDRVWFVMQPHTGARIVHVAHTHA